MLRICLRTNCFTVLCALVLATPMLAQAQDEGGAAATADEQAPAEGTGDPALSDEQALQAEGHETAVVRDSTDPFEDPHEGYYFIGLMYREIVVPKFMQGLFVDGGTTVANPGFGAQFEYRKDAFSIIGSLWWQDFAFNGPFREAGDAVTNTEMIDSSWSMVAGSASFLWSTAFNDMFAIEYGVDVGLGVVLGNGVRTEAYSTDGDRTFHPCTRALDPDPAYCGAPTSGTTDLDGQNGEHYGVTARKWSDGGSVPNVIPWLGLPHIGLRIKPIHQLQIRIDGGFFAGFWFGGSLSYGI
jgi:hypothetical protein